MTEKAAYDAIAKDYQESKQLPFRMHIEQHMICNLLGPLEGKSVLDLACGDGIYSRRIKARGAKTVIGGDISAEMIALAETEEKRHPCGVHYAVGDAAAYRAPAACDVVLGAYLLNYAKAWEELVRFCQAISENLHPGGRFVGCNDNPANAPRDDGRYRKYGFYKTTPANRTEGEP